MPFSVFCKLALELVNSILNYFLIIEAQGFALARKKYDSIARNV